MMMDLSLQKAPLLLYLPLRKHTDFFFEVLLPSPVVIVFRIQKSNHRLLRAQKLIHFVFRRSSTLGHLEQSNTLVVVFFLISQQYVHHAFADWKATSLQMRLTPGWQEDRFHAIHVLRCELVTSHAGVTLNARLNFLLMTSNLDGSNVLSGWRIEVFHSETDGHDCSENPRDRPILLRTQQSIDRNQLHIRDYLETDLRKRVWKT
jgi:hypothetical protein